MEFEQSFRQVVGHEGGWSRDPNDRGNWTSGVKGVGELRGTRFGISAAQYPALDIEALSLDDARTIYLRDYWLECRCEQLPDPLRVHVFDGAVNSGVAASSRWLQLAVGSTPDGHVGPRTIGAARAAEPWGVIARFNAHRLMHMTDADGWRFYGRGWARRLAANVLGSE